MGTRQWYCVQTKPRKEDLVLAHLEDKRLPYYRPRLRAPSRRGSRVVPLFPGYLFVSLASVGECVDVRYTPGVRRLLGYGDEPFPIDESLIELIRARESGDGVIRPCKLFRFREQERVRLSGGAFDGLEALFQEYLPGKQRAQVLLQMLGRQVPVQVSVNHILPASV